MGRKTWFDIYGKKKGEWTAEEDKKLAAYIREYGLGEWRSLPQKAGLQRCGKSCRLRWLNYLRPGIKRGKFTPREEDDIIKFHALLGNRWAAIAKKMENRTDNDIKNHWNSCLKKRLTRNGIDPMTHKPITNIKTINEECGSSSTATSGSLSSSSSSNSACLLNKLAKGISSRQHNIDRIRNILSSPNIGSSHHQDQEEKELAINQNIEVNEEDAFPMWDYEEVRRYMEIDVMKYDMTSYGSGLYESTQILDPLSFDSI